MCSTNIQKSPVKKVVKGFSASASASASVCKFLKFNKKSLKVRRVVIIGRTPIQKSKAYFSPPNFSSTTIDSSKDKSLLTMTGREFL